MAFVLDVRLGVDGIGLHLYVLFYFLFSRFGLDVLGSEFVLESVIGDGGKLLTELCVV